MTAKIRIKMGDVEIEYEGSEEFLKTELGDLISGVVDLHRVSPKTDSSSDGDEVEEQSDVDDGGYALTTNSVAAKLGAASGQELMIAAVSKLTIVDNKTKITRADLLKEMQEATSYYKKSYSKNLTSNLKTLVTSDRLREIAKNTYSLSAPELNSSRTKLKN